jgi:hypothetical protein
MSQFWSGPTRGFSTTSNTIKGIRTHRRGTRSCEPRTTDCRELFKRSEVNWLKEKQALLNELEITRDERQEEYRTMRPDRDFADKEAKVAPAK